MTIPARRWPGSTGLRMCCGRREGRLVRLAMNYNKYVEPRQTTAFRASEG